jgi:hypothetical protein
MAAPATPPGGQGQQPKPDPQMETYLKSLAALSKDKLKSDQVQLELSKRLKAIGLDIVSIHNDVNTNVNQIGKAFTEVNRISRETVRIGNSIFSNQQNENKKILENGKIRKDIVAILQKQQGQVGFSAEGQQAANQLVEEEIGLLDTRAELYGYSGKLAELVSAQLKKGLSIEKIREQAQFKTIEAYQKQVDQSKKDVEARLEALKVTKELEGAMIPLNALHKESVKYSNTFLLDYLDAQESTKDLIQSRGKLIELMKTEGTAGSLARDLAQSEVDLLKDQAELMGYSGKTLEYVVEQRKKGLSFSKIENTEQFTILNTFEKKLNFEKKSLELQNKVKEKTEEIRKSHDSIKDALKLELKFAAELGKDPKLFGAFAAHQLGHAIQHANHRMHELVDTGMQAGEAISIMREDFSLMGMVGMSKVADVSKTLVQNFGSAKAMTEDQRAAVGEMAYSYGLAGDEATNLVMAVSRLPGETMDTAVNVKQAAEQAGKMKGVLPSQIMKEMAKNTGLMATYSKGGVQGFANAAAQAKKLGIEMSSILNAGRKTLDFESSMNSQLEASVLLGKELNFDKLRAASLAGDANAILREQSAILSQVGSLDKMNVLEKEKLAEAMGMTVEELTKFNTEQQHSAKYFGETAGPLDKVIGYTGKYTDAIGGFIMQNATMILGIGQLISQHMLLGAIKSKDIAQTAAQTAASTTNTGAQIANSNAAKLNVAQLKAFKAMRAADIPAQQAMTAARSTDTAAITTNTGAQQLSQGATQKGIFAKIGEKVATLASSAAKKAESIVTSLATGAQQFYNTSKEKGILVALRDVVVKGARRAATLLSAAATTFETNAETIGQAVRQKGILTYLKDIAAAGIRRADKLLGISVLYQEMTAENINQTTKQKGILTMLKDAAVTAARAVGKLFGIGVTKSETAAENINYSSRLRSIATTITQTVKEGLRRVGRLLGIGVTSTETATEVASDVVKKRSIFSTIAQTAQEGLRKVGRLLGIGVTATETATEVASDVVKKRSTLSTIAQIAQEGLRKVGRLFGIGVTASETATEVASDVVKKRSVLSTIAQTVQENLRKLGRLAGIGVTTTETVVEATSDTVKKRGILSTMALTAVTLTRNLVVGAGNLIMGTANALLTVFGLRTATAATSAAGGAPGLIAFGMAVGTAGAAMIPAIPVILAFGAAILMATPALYVLGEVVKVIAVVIGNVLMKALEMLPAIVASVAAGFTQVFKVLAENWQILIPVGLGIAAIAGSMVLLAGSLFLMAPVAGILAIVGASLLAIGMGVKMATDGLTNLANSVAGLEAVATALQKISAELAIIGTAGVLALPVITAMSTLGAGGGKQEQKPQAEPKEDKMDILIGKIDEIIAMASKPGVINIDGRKLADFIRLGINATNVA